MKNTRKSPGNRIAGQATGFRRKMADMSIRRLVICLVLISGLVLVGSVNAEPIVYPAKGQSQEQQNKDQWECHQWAVQQTGVDPQKMAEQTSSGEVYQQQHRVLGGAARGALLGVVGGAIGGDAGKGAAIGAGVGALAGLFRSRRDLETQHEVTESVHAQQSAALNRYDRAYCTCLQGRGYTANY